MPPVECKFDVDPAVHSAQAAFRYTARQQIKRLVAQGLQADAASRRLMDELIQHRSPHAISASSSQSVQHIVDRTGFSREQASRTLLLHQEIARLRGEGHTTATLIEQLHSRLRKVGHASRNNRDENGESASQRRVHGGPLPKKHKLNEEGAITTYTSTVDYLPHCSQKESAMCHGTENSEKRRRDDSRSREESSPFAQLKKLKLRAGQGFGDS